ncbi:MAG: serine hydrolase domain-containing protein [Sphingomicrobium sp.]
MTEVQELLDAAVVHGIAPGVVAMVADHSGVLLSAAAGFADVERATPMTAGALFMLASMTKLVTSIAALQLVEQGRLELDAPIARLLPQLSAPRVLTGFADDGSPIDRPAARPITLRHLMTHTAGFGYDGMNPKLMRARGPAGPPPPTSLAALDALLLFDPGEGWEYGISTDWVGLAVEAASGDTLEAWLTAMLFAPLGLRDFSFFVPPADLPRRVPLALRLPDGGFVPIPCPIGNREQWQYLSGGAGLFGTAGDYLQLLRMLLNRGELDGVRVLGEASVASLFRNEVGELAAGRTGTTNPALYQPYDPLPGTRSGWSLGGQINPVDVPGGRHASSLGWAGIANSYYWVDPASDRCAVLMAQFLPFADPRFLGLLRDFELAVYAEPR